MANKLKINEQQLSVIVEYIKTGKVKPNLNESELLEEGVKGWVMTGLIALASMTGQGQNKVNAEDEQDIQHYIDAAQKVQQEIEKDPEKAILFKDAAKQMNINNLNALLQVDPKDEVVIKNFTTNNLKTVDTRVKHGEVITDIQIKTDTVWSDLPESLELLSDIESNIDGNLFISGTFDLNPDIAEELSFQFQRINDDNSTLKNVTIHSSTDKEPLKQSTINRLVNSGYSGDNEGLSKARKNTIYNYLVKTLKINENLITLDVVWEKGPDVYSSDMSDAERQAAKDLPGTTKARNVSVDWSVTKELQGESNEPIYKLVHKYQVQLTGIKTPIKGGKIPNKGHGRKTIKLKPPKCKLKGGMIPCSFN